MTHHSDAHLWNCIRGVLGLRPLPGTVPKGQEREPVDSGFLLQEYVDSRPARRIASQGRSSFRRQDYVSTERRSRFSRTGF